MDIRTERERFKRAMGQAALPPMEAVRDLSVPGGDGPLRARLLVPEDAFDVTLVYVHGGGVFLGDLDTPTRATPTSLPCSPTTSPACRRPSSASPGATRLRPQGLAYAR